MRPVRRNLTPDMSKPFPIIHLPNMADHERLIRGLWRMGYRTGWSRRTWDEDRTWASWPDPRLSGHTYIYVYSPHLISRATFKPTDKTLVNSINHFLSYVKGMEAAKAAPVPAPVYTVYTDDLRDIAALFDA